MDHPEDYPHYLPGHPDDHHEALIIFLISLMTIVPIMTTLMMLLTILPNSLRILRTILMTIHSHWNPLEVQSCRQ